MKTHLQKFGLLFLMIYCLGSSVKADTYDWLGAVSSDVNDARNWSLLQPGALFPKCPDVPGSDDDIRIGVATTYFPSILNVNNGLCALNVLPSNIPYNFAPTVTSNTTWNSITLGTNVYSSTSTPTGIVLTVTGATLTVTGNITLNVFTGGGTNATQSNYLKGTGTINCGGNIIVGGGTGTAARNYYLFSEVSNLNVTGNVNVNLRSTLANGSGFRLQQGNMSIAGQILFQNTGGVTALNSGYFTIDAKNLAGNKSTVTLTLSNPNAIGNLPLTVSTTNLSNLSTVNFNGTSLSGGKITVVYTASNPTIYTTSTQGFGTGGGTINAANATYDNLTINATGTSTIGTGTGVLKTDSAITIKTGIVSFANNTTTTIGTDWTNNSGTTVNGGQGTTDINGSLSNAGTMTMGTGDLTIAKNYTNTGVFTPNTTALITFDGTTAQTLIDNTAAGTKFNNVTFSAGTTGATSKRMKLGSNFFVNPTYTLNVTNSGILTVENTPATYTSALTLISNATGDASIGNLTAGSIAGKIEVQRYIKGGARRYMLISSPVADTTNATISSLSNSYSLKPIILPGAAGSKLSTIVTGPNGSAAGFDNAPATGNSPSVFVYNEAAPSTTDKNQIAGNEYKAFTNTSATIPMGNGILLYFRGSRDMINTATGAPFVRPFPAADDATLTFFGGVIKGTTATNSPMTPNIINLPITTSTDASTYPLAGTTYPTILSWRSTASSKKGYNLVGNPYASVIDLAKVGALNTSLKFYYLLIKNAATGTNSSSTRFVLCNTTNTTTPTIGTGGSQYVLSGQGFFVVAPAANTSIKFDEGVKVPYTTYTNTTPPIFNIKKDGPAAVKTMTVNSNRNISTQQTTNIEAETSAASNTNTLPWLRLDMMQDSSTFSTTDIYFNKNAQNNFVPGEDAPYLASSGQGNFFFSQTADSVGCFANYTASLEKIKKVNLFVAFSTFGTYKLTSPIKQNIDERYTIYLKDKFTGDSLDIVHNLTYTFNVSATPASYATDRFYLSIGITPGNKYKLLGFNGEKITSGIQLTWKADNESNFTTFILEKSINNGTSFTAIDSLQSNGEGNYSYVDIAPDKGHIIYRLVQKLVTGDINISNNLAFNYLNESAIKFIVYPSTTSQSININLGKTYSNNVKVNIVSASGGLVKTINASNIDSIQQNVDNLIKGLYIVEAIDEATGIKIGSAKFFKQ
ncbi:MAG: hypothetical protein AAGC65_03595 [Mucilaginibacter sp.]|uniref:hypothetical protein n=1 Tax=Mucilaginibacter sp. TaxID=1882438 RepID=UPI0031A97214